MWPATKRSLDKGRFLLLYHWTRSAGIVPSCVLTCDGKRYDDFERKQAQKSKNPFALERDRKR